MAASACAAAAVSAYAARRAGSRATQEIAAEMAGVRRELEASRARVRVQAEQIAKLTELAKKRGATEDEVRETDFSYRVRRMVYEFEMRRLVEYQPKFIGITPCC